MDRELPRRRFLQAASHAVGASACAAVIFSGGDSQRVLGAEEKGKTEPAKKRFTLGFSLYGMNSLPIEDAIRACAAIGYHDIEPALMPGYSAEPQQLTKSRRMELRKLIEGLGLAVPALMENIGAIAPAEAQQMNTQQVNIEKIARAAELAHDLAPAGSGGVPVLETVLGGKPSEWEKVRGRIGETLSLWAAAGEKHGLTIAVKAHIGNALHTPGDLKQLIADVGSPRIRAAYDYSHFERQGLGLEESLRAVAAETVFIHVKDGKGEPAAFQFLLPGEGSTDYVRYFRLLDQLQYRGSATVEVSGQIHKQPGYDPIATAKKCYRSLQAAYETSVG